MTINKRKKNSRQRGSKTHGWGAKKKHRGSGNRGGKGMAGSGKRADTKKPSLWKERYFGKVGFTARELLKINPINLDYLEDNINNLVKNKLATEEGGFFIVDCDKLGFNKLLGSGKVNNKYKISVMFASKGAVGKIEKAGGKVVAIKNESNKETTSKG